MTAGRRKRTYVVDQLEPPLSVTAATRTVMDRQHPASSRHPTIRNAIRRSPTASVSSMPAATRRPHDPPKYSSRYDKFRTSGIQEAFEKCWAHSPLRAAARRITIHQVSLLSRRTPPAHRRPRRRRRRQRQRVTEGTAMAPWNGPNKV